MQTHKFTVHDVYCRLVVPPHGPTLGERARHELMMTAAKSIGGQIGPTLKYACVALIAKVTRLAGLAVWLVAELR